MLKRTCAFCTLGCKVNQYETQKIRESLYLCGFEEVTVKNPADLVVVNTCTVTCKADRESRNALRQAVTKNSDALIVAAGCYAEAEPEQVREILGENGIVVGNRDKDNICLKLGYRQQPRAFSGISGFANRTRAFVKIQDGCNNHCSYCKIPYVRGGSRSRPLEEIVSEVQRLVDNDFKEIVLTGICLGSYKDNSYELASVIERLDKIDGLLRLRISSIEPKDVTDMFLKTIAISKKVCHHLHIPFQSADDRILQMMNRDYTISDYLDTVCRMRLYLADSSISTDIMVGFPGESDAEFEKTMEFLNMIKPTRIHIFPFSPRKLTPAYHYKDKVPPEIIEQRVHRLQGFIKERALGYAHQLIGCSLKVLIEQKEKNGYFSGYAETYHRVLIIGKDVDINAMKSIRIAGIKEGYLVGVTE